MGTDDTLTHLVSARVTRKDEAFLSRLGGNSPTKGIRRAIAIAEQVERSGGIGLAASSVADRLRAIAGELDSQSRAVTVAPSGAVVVSEPTAEKIHQLRSATDAALLTMPAGVMLFGLGPDDEEACFALDAEAGVLGITTRSLSESRKLTDVCPAVHALAQLLAGVLARCASAAVTGDGPEAAPPGQYPHLRLAVWGAHPDDGLARIELGGASVRVHSLQLTALCAELFALQGRLVADAIGRRQQLEAALSRTPSRRETAIAWERSHGE